MANEIAKKQDMSLMTFSQLMNDPRTKRKFTNMLGNGVAEKRMQELIGLYNTNPMIQNCTPVSLVQCALQAATLRLNLNPVFGQCAIVPYSKRVPMPVLDESGNFKKDQYGRIIKQDQWVSYGQFQVQWKGWYQLIMRSGKYKCFNFGPVFKDEGLDEDYLTGEIKILFNKDPDSYRKKFYKSDKKTDIDSFGTTFDELVNRGVIGFYCFFETTTGFRHTEYWDLLRIEAHARRYSKSYRDYLNPPIDRKTGRKREIKPENVLWVHNFQAMAEKTVAKMTLSRFGILDLDLATAMNSDQKVYSGEDIEDDGKFLDNPNEAEFEEVTDNTVQEQDQTSNEHRKNPSSADIMNKVSQMAEKQPQNASAESKGEITPERQSNASETSSRAADESYSFDQMMEDADDANPPVWNETIGDYE